MGVATVQAYAAIVLGVLFLYGVLHLFLFPPDDDKEETAVIKEVMSRYSYGSLVDRRARACFCAGACACACARADAAHPRAAGGAHRNA